MESSISKKVQNDWELQPNEVATCLESIVELNSGSVNEIIIPGFVLIAIA